MKIIIIIITKVHKLSLVNNGSVKVKMFAILNQIQYKTSNRSTGSKWSIPREYVRN